MKLLSSTSSHLINYRRNVLSWNRAPSTSMAITIQTEVYTGKPYVLHTALRVHTILIHTASSHTFPVSKISYTKTAPHGNITRDNFRAWPLTSVASTAVFHPLHVKGLHPPKQFITLFDGSSNADQKVTLMFASVFGASLPRGGKGQYCRICIWNVGIFENPVIPSLTSLVQAGKQ